MAKVSVIGAGNVGATVANAILHMKFCSEVVLLDIKEGVSEGKALDMTQTSIQYGFNTKVTGVTNNYEATAGSDVVVITSGIPRKPGMTREELIGVNAGIVNGVVSNVLKYSPDTIIVIIANPMDTMTYLTYKTAGIAKNKVIGMGGILDSSRFSTYLSQAMNVPQTDIQAMVIGGHGDTTMIPLIRFANYKGIPAQKMLSKEVAEKVVADTMVGGATLTKLLGTSAWYAPGASAAVLVKSIILNEHKTFPCCVALDGEYGQKDICIGVPVMLGKNGIEKIVELDLNNEEKALFEKSAEAVRKTNGVLKEMGLVK